MRLRRPSFSAVRSTNSNCGAYDGLPLGWLVKACKAPDGSYGALEAWQRGLPNYGVAPTSAQSAWELYLSHWTGELPVLTIKLDWSYRRFQHLYGSFVYQGSGVLGFRSTRGGMPLDTYGRNLYVDTFGRATRSARTTRRPTSPRTQTWPARVNQRASRSRRSRCASGISTSRAKSLSRRYRQSLRRCGPARSAATRQGWHRRS